jgi:nucleoside-diphosphate-sugar epimerase
LRYFNVFGPRQSLENKYAVVIPKFIVSLLGEDSPPIYGDGNQERDFIYIDNVVDANILALTKDKIGGQVFNIAGGNAESINNLFQTVQELTAKSQGPKYLEPRPGDVRKTLADITKAKELLGWQPKVGFKKGLEKTVEWFRNYTESKWQEY